jgi:hypothetical protein
MPDVGQKNWADDRKDVTENNYVVKSGIFPNLYYAAELQTDFAKLNGPRELRTAKNIHRPGQMQIPDGKDSPVHAQNCDENNTVVFTLREPNTGMATYGDAPVKTGGFARYMHTEVNVRVVSSPAFPVVGYESQQNIRRVVKDLVAVEKDNIARWISQEMDLDAYRAIFHGASRGLLSREDGGMDVRLEGATAPGQYRSPLNTLVASEDDVTPIRRDVTAHNTELAQLLLNLQDTDAHYFTYRTHELIGFLINKLGLAPVKIGGREYRAVVLTDEWNIYHLRDRTGPLSEMWQNATPRSDTNAAIYNQDWLRLDNILYVPTRKLSYFRPSVNNGVITYGVGMDIDPRSKTYNNTSNYLPSIVMGAGALLRGTRKGEVKITVEKGPHEKGLEFAQHYQDGWRRPDWFAQDGRTDDTSLMNDSSFVVFNYGKSPMAAAV